MGAGEGCNSRGGELGAASHSTHAHCVAKNVQALPLCASHPSCTRERSLHLAQWASAALNWFVLLNSLTINEYKVLKKDALAGKSPLKQSLDRKYVCAESAPSHQPCSWPCAGWLMPYRHTGWFSVPLPCPRASYGLPGQWGFTAGRRPTEKLSGTINAAALLQHRANTTDVPINGVSFPA